MTRTSLKVLAALALGAAVFAGARTAAAQTAPVGNSIVGSVHNLNNVYGAGTVTDDWGANQVCQPCHTPHQMPAQNVTENLTRLWNHTLKPANSYTLYGSGTSYLTSIDETSRKCLGCHDGTIAVDSYGSSPKVSTTGTMASNSNTAGFVIGAGGDLRHDHPIDVLYNSASSYVGVSTYDAVKNTYAYSTTWSGRNNDPATFTITGYTSSKWGAKTYTQTALSAISFYKPTGNTQSVTVKDANATGGTANGDGTYTHTISVQSSYVYCRSCHDPHNDLYSFMRVPNDNSQVCLTCHNK